MTKFYEEYVRENIDDLEAFKSDPKGELTVVISEKLKEKKEELLRPMDQIYSEIENTIHYSSENVSTEKIIPENKVVIKEALKPTTKKVEK